MPALTLAAVGVVHLATALAFAAVGRRFARRDVPVPLRQGRNAFVAWWLCFAAYLGGQGLLDVGAAFGWAPAALHAGFRYVAGPLIAAAAAGLAFHVAFLWSGRNGLAAPLAFYYGACGAAYAFMVWLHGPVGVDVTAWSADVLYERPLGGVLWAIVLASFGLPLVLGSLAYLLLVAKARGRAERYRIVLVGGSLLVWVSSGFAAQVAAGDAMRFVSIVLLGLVTVGAVTAAYFPPRSVRHWLEAAGPAAPA